MQDANIPKSCRFAIFVLECLKKWIQIQRVIVHYVVCLLVVSLLGYAIFAALFEITINLTNESADFSRNPDLFSFKLGFFLL